MKKFVIVLGLLWPVWAGAQSAADCIGAVSICDTVYTLPVLPEEENVQLNEINSFTTCLSSGEYRGRWYKFAAVDTGLLSFTILPLDTTYDFDWILFEKGYWNCAQLYGDTSLLVACDNSGINGTDGSTGADGLPGLGHQPAVHLSLPGIYYLYVSFTSADTTDTTGYVIDFSASTITLEDCGDIGVEETEPVAVVDVYPNPTSGKVFITANTSSPMRFDVMDMTGRVVLRSTQGWQVSQGFDMQFLPPGIYSYRLTNDEGWSTTGKILRIQ